MGCFDCLALTPFSSLIATIVLAVGLGLYCGCGLVALDKTCDMFTDTFVCCGEAEDTYESEFEQFKSALELSIYIVTPVMAVWAIALLVLSFLSTHKAKVQVYGGEKTSCGGYICNSIFIGFTYIIFLGWLLFAALTLIPLMELLSVLNSIYCFDESYKVDLNLTLYGYPVENFTDSLCDDVITAADDQMKNFCVAFNGKLTEAGDNLADKAIKAMYALKQSLPKETDCKTYIHLFNICIKPILLYGYEIWGMENMSNNNWNKIKTEKVHLKFSKHLLGLNKNTANDASEIGAFPLITEVKINMIKFWSYVIVTK
ncbi:uncharacterized protein LOC102804410 [Saccoglossus kowalevskii]|uniref:Uncharacterized protein LOC102804410 n=1 Tax=Saccoglossus kowalevskii TaxID=10224 RepID=A0ABM0M3W7_SACKO|nr:PREDICTED: uncharacterized protein LOC102804410 [Saccoglossus kowalevskii]